ncbi:MAG TPA: UDP-3-O-acyl-N-acetylglucosamine deacetylase [Bauldia sp.]|nr:UDP-3-O-acyl-N-acetylglucosamine deacetylase [Bauldia sp.]
MARRLAGAQTTLRRRATLSGVGVHSGQEVTVTLHPEEVDSGIYFYRSNLGDGREYEIPADHSYVRATDLCTTVGVDAVSVATIEHLMAAIRALEIDNVMVEVDGSEIPVLDGSAAPFVQAIEQAGVQPQQARRRYVRIERAVRVELGSSYAEFLPYDGTRIEAAIDFANPLVGRQAFALDVTPDTFRRQLARARTFGFLADVEQLWARGLCLGASLDNAVVLAEDRVLNPEGLRFPDEFARHKVLDALGDLALASAPILGCYRSWRGGHKLNHLALQTLFADRTAWSVVEVAARRDVRGEARAADLAGSLGLAALSPEAS